MKKKLSKKAIGLFIGVFIIIMLYLTAIYSSNPFIAKWRTIYIETAMSTMTHQWLATAFIPDNVISNVMNNVDIQFETNKIASSDVAAQVTVPEVKIQTPKDVFTTLFPEIDMSTMPNDVDYSTLQISDIVNMKIKTIAGDAVWAIDVPNQILIIEVKGNDYVGKLALVKDSSQVILGKTQTAKQGQTVTDICSSYNAILGINASGFVDYGGHGNGSTPVGLEISQGKKYFGLAGGRNQVCGFDKDNNFRIGCDLDLNELRDAMEFYPNIIVNGEKNVKGSFGLGLHPRAAIGQTKDKATVFLIIDGRQIGYSVGATVSDCADIMLRYNTYNALNLDGGSSASMTYNGKMITKTSSPAKAGRKVPNAWIVLAK